MAISVNAAGRASVSVSRGSVARAYSRDCYAKQPQIASDQEPERQPVLQPAVSTKDFLSSLVEFGFTASVNSLPEAKLCGVSALLFRGEVGAVVSDHPAIGEYQRRKDAQCRDGDDGPTP